MILAGASYAKVARVLGCRKRTVERWFGPGGPHRHLLDRLARQRELAAHHASVKHAQRMNLPVPDASR